MVQGAAVLESYDYDPWGLLMPGRTLGSGTKEGFTTKERDAESQQDYFGARYYVAAVGRWSTVDPPADSFPEWSPYVYVRDDPVQFRDLLGLCPEPVSCALILASTAGSVATSVGSAATATTVIGATVAGVSIANAASSFGYTVYRGVSSAGEYFGITNNPTRRQGEHFRGPHKLQIAPMISGLTKQQARAIEQVLIDVHGLNKEGGELLNKINSIAASKREEWSALLESPREMLKSAGHDMTIRPKVEKK